MSKEERAAKRASAEAAANAMIFFDLYHQVKNGRKMDLEEWKQLKDPKLRAVLVEELCLRKINAG